MSFQKVKKCKGLDTLGTLSHVFHENLSASRLINVLSKFKRGNDLILWRTVSYNFYKPSCLSNIFNVLSKSENFKRLDTMGTVPTIFIYDLILWEQFPINFNGGKVCKCSFRKWKVQRIWYTGHSFPQL